MRANWVLYIALRTASLLLPALPLGVSYWLADVAGFLAYYLVPSARRGVSENVAFVLGQSADAAQVRRVARRAFQSDAKNWVDTLRIARVTTDEVESSLHLEGWDLLEEAIGAGKGVIVVTIHLGNFDLVGQVIAARGYSLTVPVERMSPEVLFQFLTGLRRSKGITIVASDRAAREMFRALASGRIVGLAGDRGPERGAVTVNLLGRPARLPRAPAALARRTGAPVMLGIGVRVGRGQYRGFIRGPLPMTDSGNHDQDERDNVQIIADGMEEFLRRYPDQWLAFSPVWLPDRALDGPDTIEQPQKAGV